MRRLFIPIAVVLVAVLTGAGAVAAIDRGYTVSVVLPNATNLIEGGSVMRDGYEAGAIESIDVEDGKAKVEFSLDDEFAPLHEGAKVTVDWKAVLGERLLTVTDGPAENASVPSGGLLTSAMAEPVEIDKVLAALDPPTRNKLNSLITRLSRTLDGSERDINQTVRSAGPAVHALGQVLRGVGTDGEAIRQLATQLNQTMRILASRDKEIQQVVNSLADASSTVAEQRQAMGELLRRLPGTVRQANQTLGKVPDTVDKTVPLLEDMRPVAERLPSTARNLRPVLADLRPAMKQLRPTLDSTAELLRATPGLLDTANATLPDATRAMRGMVPALDYLRPYTPELTGWLSNWASATGNYDANGHYGRIFIQNGLESGNVNPGITGPGVEQRPAPLPGEIVGQPWHDAFGSGMR
ncbi:MAG: MCE family protein [Actinophytocola sp.]|nr:MCE family protein [Actinophytocola sp.]